MIFKKKKVFLPLIGVITSSLIILIACIPVIISQVYELPTNLKLVKLYQDWYDSLTLSPWNKDKNGNFLNYHCNSEQQAINLYAFQSGNFWNEPLHKQQEPQDGNYLLPNLDKKIAHEVKGSDYKYLESSLLKARTPQEMIVYHGVEYMEVEFYEQLKPYINKTSNGYDYSKCIGKTIQSYGFVSTSLSLKIAYRFLIWKPSTNNINHSIQYNPLKEPVIMVINIPKDYIGAAFLGNFSFVGTKADQWYPENQVLINRNCKFLIKGILKQNFSGKSINMFYVDLVS